MVPHEPILRTGWKQWSVESTRRYLESKRETPSRLRLCTRGEPIAYKSDIDKILHIADRMPNLQFWIPTRSWRNPQLRRCLESRIIRKSNVRHNIRLQASLDPSNTRTEWASLVSAGWSTMFFGDDIEHPLGNAVKCPKTWDGRHGHCAVCRSGCFRMGQTHIWLKRH